MSTDLTRFRGVFPAIITPMTQEDELNEEQLRAVFDMNIAAGAHGFWIAGGTGESILLSDEENRRIASIAVEQVGERATTIMHVGTPTTTRAAALAEHAARVGAHAICCIPPFFYRRSDKEIVEHYRAVAAASNLPLFVYNLPGSTGVEITVDLMQKIQDGVPQLAGLKHSSPNLLIARQFADMGLSCFTGSSHLLLPALTMGACGCVDGPPCLAPEPWVDLWTAAGKGDADAAEQARQRSYEIIDVCKMFGSEHFHATCKAAVGLRLGLHTGNPRRPALPLTGDQRRQLADRLATLGRLP
jgi:dihydrodipicolinate synthase/N-acetylneuraminate lyase